MGVQKLGRLYVSGRFLWDIFHHFVEAAIAMRYGPADGGWEGHEIVHRDIKPGNSPTPMLFLTIANVNRDQSFGARRTGRAGSHSVQ